MKMNAQAYTTVAQPIWEDGDRKTSRESRHSGLQRKSAHFIKPDKTEATAAMLQELLNPWKNMFSMDF